MPAPMLPSLSVKWGDYDKPDPEEESKIVTTVRTAMGGGSSGGDPLITKRIALEKIRGVFPIENVEAVLEELEKESEERADRELEAAKAVLDAEASAFGAGKAPGANAAGKGGDSGRPPSGQKPPGGKPAR